MQVASSSIDRAMRDDPSEVTISPSGEKNQSNSASDMTILTHSVSDVTRVVTLYPASIECNARRFNGRPPPFQMKHIQFVRCVYTFF
ncbi:hypothetical protein MCC01970_00230 [Bifidobacteriaceae bacterium MCC01970]|jgi:hypothetical protein|nr:hypothetical protein MCC01970_00230 [Bifidobacteriaceae bacterium MCC01970]